MEELREKLNNVEGRIDSILSEITELEQDIDPEKGAEGTVRARVSEARSRLIEAQKRIGNAISLTEF